MLIGNKLRRSLIWPCGSQQDQQSSQTQPRWFQSWKSPRLTPAQPSLSHPHPLLDGPHTEKISLLSFLTFLFQLMPFTSHPPATRCCEEPGSIFSITSLYAPQNAAKLPQNCPFSRLNKLHSLSFSTHVGQLLLPLTSVWPSVEFTPVYQYLSCTVCPKRDTVFWTLNTTLLLRLDLTGKVGFTRSKHSQNTDDASLLPFLKLTECRNHWTKETCKSRPQILALQLLRRKLVSTCFCSDLSHNNRRF